MLGLGGNMLRVVVVTVTVNGAGDAPLTLTGEVGTVQTACVGAPVQDIVTEPVNPPKGLTCRL